MVSPEFRQAAELLSANREWLAVLGTLLIGALSEKQRTAVIEMYGYRCYGKELGMSGQHHGRIEVNHDPPQSWSITQGLDPDGDHVAYIPLCEYHHDQYHNGDIAKAKIEFKHGDKLAFKKMSERNKENASKGIVFWQDKYSIHIQTLYRRTRTEAEKRGWFMPKKNERKEKTDQL